jgi:hypothetical protein
MMNDNDNDRGEGISSAQGEVLTIADKKVINIESTREGKAILV